MTTLPAPPSKKPFSNRWYSPRSIVGSILLRPRFYLATVAALAILVLLPPKVSSHVRDACAWVAGGLVYLVFSVRTMWACPAEIIIKRAARNDDSAMVILTIILIAICASFASIVGLLGEAKTAAQHSKWFYLALAAATIVISWSVMQVAFTLHYAHDYYRPSISQPNAKQGLLFPGDENPDYWDFLYFATSIGATSQTSDVAIRTRSLRRLATLHAVLSFFFNAAVLALMINLAAGLI